MIIRRSQRRLMHDAHLPQANKLIDELGLLTVEGDRHLELTEDGLRLATRVMRKHRLAERLLIDVIGLEWELVHEEACRWEHVMSETVERRLLELLDHPTESPYGNPIPGLGLFSTMAEGQAGAGQHLLPVLDGLLTDLGFREYTATTNPWLMALDKSLCNQGFASIP